MSGDEKRMKEAMNVIREICRKGSFECVANTCPFWYYCGTRHCPDSWEEQKV